MPNEIQLQRAVIDITDITGKKVFSMETRNKEIISPAIDLPNGMYVVSIATDKETYLAKLSVVK